MRGADLVVPDDPVREGVAPFSGIRAVRFMPVLRRRSWVHDCGTSWCGTSRPPRMRREGLRAPSESLLRSAQGKPGVCFATFGAGRDNLVTGLADALADSGAARGDHGAGCLSLAGNGRLPGRWTRSTHHGGRSSTVSSDPTGGFWPGGGGEPSSGVQDRDVRPAGAGPCRPAERHPDGGLPGNDSEWVHGPCAIDEGELDLARG